MSNKNITTNQTNGHRAGRFGKNILSLVGACLLAPSAYLAQQTYSFTNCTAFGPTGPTQSMVNAAYASTNLNGSVTIVTPGIQQFTIPITGGYRIEAWGGQGYGAGGVGGRGAYISGEFQLTAGTVLKILVGQQGELPTNSSYNAQYGGGGGSYVTDLSNVPYVVAGGGGANWSSSYSTVSDAPTTTSGNGGAGVGSTGSTGGSGGLGGATANSADGGAGITGNGAGTSAGTSFVNGGTGGFVTYGIGGFGGGGGTSSFNNRRAGGGGGYSGGGGAEGVTTGFPEGGGGGSYNNGTNQTNTSGVNIGHGRVVISELCAITANASTNPICIGASVTLTTSAGTPSWSTGGSSGVIIVTPTVTTTYSVAGTGSANCLGNAAITVTVKPLPVVQTVVTPTLICVGGTANIVASGASTYTWTTGGPSSASTTANPIVNTVYSVTGTSPFGCVNSSTFIVRVNTNTLGITASNTTVCAGTPVNLTATGANSYTWSNGSFFQSISVNPSANTNYTVSGRDVNYCLLSKTVAVAVNPNPTVSTSKDRSLVCKGESVTLSATGASNYTWIAGPSSPPISGAVSPSITVTLPVDVNYYYSVVGVDAQGCADTAAVVVSVSKCVGIAENRGNNPSLTVFPNPGNGQFTLALSNGLTAVYQVLDLSGRIVLSDRAAVSSTTLDLTTFANGIYFLRVQTENGLEVVKLVKQ